MLVIAGGSKPVYNVERGVWRLMAERLRQQGVHIYLTAFRPDLAAPRLSNSSIVFPGSDSLVPGGRGQAPGDALSMLAGPSHRMRPSTCLGATGRKGGS